MKVINLPHLFFLMCLFFSCSEQNSKPQSNLAQEDSSKYALNINSACGYHTEIKKGKIYTFNSELEAELAVARIMKLTGLPSNFIIKAANVDNAAATVICQDSKNCVRYILYNQEFMRLVKDSTKTHFSEIAILAHEIGHHLSGHTLLTTSNNYDQELEADRFSGFIMYLMGASLDQAQAAVKKLCSDNGSLTHPPKSARLAAIANGWYDAEKNSSSSNVITNKNKIITPNKINSTKPDKSEQPVVRYYKGINIETLKKTNPEVDWEKEYEKSKQ